MKQNSQETKRYFEEVTRTLRRGGFHVEQIEDGNLGVWMGDHPVCEVNEIGGITYKSENIATPEREAYKDKAFSIVCRTAEYMRQMERSPGLQADGLEENYKLLAEFNGTVLAGMRTTIGVVFTTWDRTPDGSGLVHGHYFMMDYEGAKQDFATRSCLIPEHMLFTSEQRVEIYRCCADTLDSGFDLTYKQEKCIKGVQEQIKCALPDILDRIREIDEIASELEVAEPSL